MTISEYVNKISPSEASTFAHKLITALTGGWRANALAGLTFFSIASLAFLELSLVLNIFMFGVALVTTFSIIAISLQERAMVTVDKYLPMSDKPSPKLCLSDITEQKPHPKTLGLADTIEQKAPNTPSPRPRVVQFVDDDISKSKNSPIQICTFSAGDSVQSELTAASAVITKGSPAAVVEETMQEEASLTATTPNTALLAAIASATKDNIIASEADTQTRGAMTAVAKVSHSLLPENVLKGTATDVFDITHVPVPEATASETVSKKKISKKGIKTFKGEGVIHFLYHTKMWGRIRLLTPTKWGENQVFFHRNHLSGNMAALLLHGQTVNVEYFYRRRNRGNVDSLRACRVELTTDTLASKKKQTPVIVTREKQSWRSRSMLRRPISPIARATLTRATSPRSGRVAKGPPADGRRGFYFQRTLK